ncbi:hypothetical protein SAMN05443247_06120 [Bradyrhizobium erythrophlei]|jgi:hypothetical protein|nr:hypothetical protein SAMN05443247_06120 [Bradyrhizobium erythrophlei]
MRKVGFIISPGYLPMGFAVATPFEIANRQAAEPVYDIRMLPLLPPVRGIVA